MLRNYDLRELIEPSIYSRLPKELQDLTENFEGRERDIVLLSSIGVLSNCFPNLHGYYDGDRVFPQLYIVIIAPAASGKGVMNYSRLLIQKIHNKIFSETKSNFILCEKENRSKKKEKTDCPEIKVKILPANISTAEMYSYLGRSNHGLVIIESEADTMSNMLKNDWSNYSDVLRKAFHHEALSISRKIESVFEDIEEPKLAMILSGTPDQLQPLIKSKENGLFSRLVIYNFDEIAEFKDVFDKKARNHKAVFNKLGDDIFNIYGKLTELESLIEFNFSESQENGFLEKVRLIRTIILENEDEGFLANLHRHGLVFFRIAMILSALRNKDQLHTIKKLECSDVDFDLSYELMSTLLKHSQFTYDTIDSGGLSIQDDTLLDALGSNFKTKIAYEVGEKHRVTKRTMIDKLQQWQKRKIIKRIKKGEYKKL